MTKETYTYRGTRYTRIPKNVARKLYNDGVTVHAAPVKFSPFGMWFNAYGMNKASGEDFDTLVNSFEFYNCTNETGRYTAFWRAE